MADAIVSLKLTLAPDAASAKILDGQSKICNWLYNNLLEQANNLRQDFIQTQNPESAKILYTNRGLRNLVPKVKEENPFLKVVHSSPLKNAALRLSSVIQAYQKSRKGKRAGKKTGWPKFRSWKANWFSLLFDEPKKGFKLMGNNLQLSLGIGLDKKERSVLLPVKDANKLNNKKIHTLRITKESNQFFVVFTVSKTLPKEKPIEKVIAIDPNHKNLGYGVDTKQNAIEIESPWWLKTYDIRIDELKSKRDKCKRKSVLMDVLNTNGEPIGQRWQASKRWQKYNTTLDNLLKKRREQTKTYLYTVANKLYKHYDYVAIGDYTPCGNGISTPMRRAMNNRSLIGRFKEILSWVALRSGKHYLEYNEKGTTRTCHQCGYIARDGIEPNLREWKCPECNTEHIRDENAGINGLKIALSEINKTGKGKTLSVPCSGRAVVKQRRAWRVLPSGVYSTSRGQNCAITAQAPGN